MTIYECPACEKGFSGHILRVHLCSGLDDAKLTAPQYLAALEIEHVKRQMLKLANKRSAAARLGELREELKELLTHFPKVEEAKR